MARITWTDSAPVDGTTVLTAARWEQLKTDIGAQLGVAAGAAGNITADNIPDGTITRLKMATDNRDSLFTVFIQGNISVTASGDPGITAGAAAQNLINATATAALTLVAIDYSANIVTGGTGATVQPLINGSPVGSSDNLPASSSAQTVQRSGMSVAVTSGQTIGLRVTRTGAADAQVRGFGANFYFERQLT
jgi:hypothetical protein